MDKHEKLFEAVLGSYFIFHIIVFLLLHGDFVGLWFAFNI